MFQTFNTTARPEQGPSRLAALRDKLSRAGVDGFFVPRADVYQGEYVAPHDERLLWLTGFTGSAGFCIVLPEIAGVFVDGRYRTQVKAQVDLGHFTPVNWPEVKPAEWLKEMLPNGGRVAFDPWLHTEKEISDLRAALEGSGVELCDSMNFIDEIWADQPAPPRGKVRVHPLDYAGESAAEKRARLGDELSRAGQTAAVLTLPDSISWLLNIRGADIPRNPVVHAFAILDAGGHAALFVDEGKLSEAVLAHLGPDITIRPPDAFADALRALEGPVRVDRATAPLAVSQELKAAGVTVAWGQDPCIMPKARKNKAEIAGMAEAHLRDGAAMVEFLAWFDQEAPKGGLTEIAAVRALESFRRATNALEDISFETICGTGPNGAIMHYRVTEDSDQPIRSGDIVVIDSGGQYLDGTTDITRTVSVGPVDTEVRACFTRVLQGMIAISRLRWPRGVAGAHLDSLARYNLWLAGQDFDHGTGHGVGAFLCVHEGPQRLSRVSDVPLEPGMILSNEPGYYREGAFGIRIENLVVVKDALPLPGGDAHRKMLCFETLTFAPIDLRLVDATALSAGDREWLNAYHAEVRNRIGPRLSDDARRWLEAATSAV
ncbi:aminopeptidase P family protein [Defluviimonas sp. WL0002]|uniref:Aminopeptidase P family protein n=1 Tax=Albidovulum marisflavi TaxID=2984159 RepID=A0ABT2ZFC9_9RHOB|nr:aminopeptidase P family protein [Defluviimonas sp. WL0002]MCV2869722.1 aminopeptidase P family protein [Defluviimonas sp. WL0002]